MAWLRDTRRLHAAITEKRRLTLYSTISREAIPTVDANGKHYVREIVVRGDTVLDLGRDQA